MKVRELIDALEALNTDQEHEVFMTFDETSAARIWIAGVGLYADGDVYIEG